MTDQKTMARAIEILKEQRYYDSIQGLMGWDLWEGLSEKGQPYRQEVSGYFTRQALDQLKSPETKKVVDALREMGFYETLIATVAKAVENGMTSVAASAAASVAAAVAQSAAYLILFLVGFVLILLLWKLISHALDLVAKLPGLHLLNKTGGALFGLVQACILLFVAAWLLQFFGRALPENLVEQTHLLKFFMTTNPFTLLGGL